MNYIYRNISEAIKSAVPFFPVITITGPRQSGKTTLCKQLFPEFAYVNLEDLSVREQVLNDVKGFLNGYPKGLVIDESHYVPELFSYIQVLVDENRSRKFVLTGSSNFSLLQSITQSLAGRTALFTLLPFSLHEIKDKLALKTTDQILLDGFYPAVHAGQTPRELLYKNYYTTYVERDLRQLISIKNIKLFQTFIRLCAGRIGTEFNASSLSGEVGVSVPTITEWVTILSASYIVHLLPPYYENIGKRLIKTPKIYFYDTGLACYLLGIENEQQLSTHPLKGPLFENMVVNEFIKNKLNKGKDTNLYFYRDKSQHEVDLLHVRGMEIDAYEIKSSKTFHKDFYKGLSYVKKLFGERISKAAVVYDGEAEVDSELSGVYNFRTIHLD
jgi:hypothetical protein